MQELKDQVYTVTPGDQYIAPLIEVLVFAGMWTKDALRGKDDHIRFEDVTVTAWGIPPSHLRGYDPEHAVRDIAIKNLRINGQVMTDLKAAGFESSEFVYDIKIEA